jgi:hypothetical protein
MAADKVLARGWRFDIGATPTQIKGLTSFKVSDTNKTADTTTFEDAGRDTHIVVSRGQTITLEGYFLEDASKVRDPGQQAVETLAKAVGTASLDTLKITSPGGKTWTAQVSAKLGDRGGANDDPTSWGVEFTVSGSITEV